MMDGSKTSLITDFKQHVHDLLIVRCEAAAQRIILLQYRGSEM